MKRICTDLNDMMLEEMERIVNTCNENGTIISEVRITNNSIDKIEVINPQSADGLLTVTLDTIIK